MKKKIILLLVFIITAVPLLSQEQDTIIDLKNLPPYKPPANSMKVSNSNGWFPVPVSTDYYYGIGWALGNNWDLAGNLRSRGLLPTTNGYSGINPFKDKQLERRYAYTNAVDNKYKVTEFGYFSFEGKVAFKNFPCFHIFGISAMNNIGMLYTKDLTKSYLNYKGEKVPFTEGGIVTLSEWFITLKYGLEVPIYGVLFNVGEYSLNSYYYFRVAPLLALSFESNGEQYMQVMDAKDQLRYSGGRDVYYMQKSKVFDTLNRFRLYADMAIGWDLFLGEIGFDFEIFCTYPLTSVLDDAWWGQMKAGFSMNITGK